MVTEEEFSRRTLGGVISQYFLRIPILGRFPRWSRREKISVEDLESLIDRIENQTAGSHVRPDDLQPEGRRLSGGVLPLFKLLLSRETFHRLNCIVVLAAMMLSFILPFCVITIYRELPAARRCGLRSSSSRACRTAARTVSVDKAAALVFLTGAGATLPDVRIGFRRDPHDPPGTS